MFGTRADAVVDFAYIVTVLAPLFAFLTCDSSARGGKLLICACRPLF